MSRPTDPLAEIFRQLASIEENCKAFEDSNNSAKQQLNQITIDSSRGPWRAPGDLIDTSSVNLHWG